MDSSDTLHQSCICRGIRVFPGIYASAVWNSGFIVCIFRVVSQLGVIQEQFSDNFLAAGFILRASRE